MKKFLRLLCALTLFALPLAEFSTARAATIGGVLHTSQLPQATPNERQIAFFTLGYGMFIHFGPGTFSGDEWTVPGSFPVSSYAPTAINATQWVATARAAGMKYIMFTSKHHDGFTLFTANDTTYGIGTPGVGNTTDVVAALAAACAADEVAHPGTGVKLGIYYSCWDRTRNADISNTSLDAAYNAIMMDHLTTLLTNYGPVCILWIDGATVKDGTRWGWPAVYQLMRRLQPTCVLSVNHEIGSDDLGSAPGTYPSGDIRIYNQNTGDGLKWFSDIRDDDGADCKHGTAPDQPFSSSNLPDPKTFTKAGQTYYLPWEATYAVTTTGNWFWHPDTDANLKSTATLIDQWYTNRAQGNNCVFDVGPDQNGVISTAQVNKLNALASALGIGPGSNLIDRAEGKTFTASTEASSGYVANYAGTGQSGGPRWAAAGGDTTNPFIYVDLGSTMTVSRVALYEWSADSNARTTDILIQSSPDHSTWSTITTGSGSGTWLRWGTFTFSPTSTRYVRILCTGVVNPPTFQAFRVY